MNSSPRTTLLSMLACGLGLVLACSGSTTEEPSGSSGSSGGTSGQGFCQVT
jgi:hypothetical protein